MKKLIFLLPIFFLSACSWFEPHYSSGLEGQHLPNFNLTQVDTSHFQINDLATGQPLLIFLYRANCEYCNSEIDDIVQHMPDFRNTQILLVTSDSYNSIKSFANIHHLQRYPNVILLRDSANNLMDYFKAPVVPYAAFYDKEKILKSVIIGKNDFELFKNSLDL